MMDNPNYYGLGYFGNPARLQDKGKSYRAYMRYMFARTQSMFTWSGLPDTIPQRNLELLIQTAGLCGIADVKGDLYALFGSMGGDPDPYLMPTLFTVANPALNISKSYRINEDVVIIPNDSTYTGLKPLFSRYCTQLVENDLSMLIADINIRILALITAKDDNVKQGAEQYLKDVADGKLGVVGDKMLFDAIKAQPLASTGTGNQLTQLIEYQQYLKASMFNDIGLNANYNMKRESINADEAQMNNGALLPLVDDMLRSRQIACDKINEMFGTSISVEFNSIWETTEKELTTPAIDGQAIDGQVTEPEPEPEPVKEGDE